MKFVKIALMACVLAAAMVFVSCANLVSLTEENGNLVDEKNGITYIGAPLCFEPSSLKSEPYAKCRKLKIELYEIEGQPVTDFISEPYEGIGGVWYAEGITLPTLSEFDADTLSICVEQNITVGLAAVSDKEAVSAVISAFCDGGPCAIVQSGTSYKLKFASGKYPGIFYSLIYVEGEDGENYIYDRSTKTCVDVGDVLTPYMPR